MDPSCIFCKIAAGTAPVYLVYEDDTSVAFLDLAPLREGHTLVIPRAHVPDVMADGGGQALIDIGPAIHQVSRRLMEVFNADGISSLQANRAAAGQVVFHLHVHLVPRHEGDRSPLRWDRDAEAAAAVAQTHALIAGS
ncbi:MAG TPA: HIT domain-containing protein [Acidothermaceae bacterium]|jgi:histidine triad (HIT) family protein